jgi:hypothetical protein
MKISVVADATGRILGFSHAAPARASSQKVVTALDDSDGQTVHQVELTPELAQRAHDDDFADAIFAHVVVKKGRVASLTRSATPAARSKRKK